MKNQYSFVKKEEKLQATRVKVMKKLILSVAILVIIAILISTITITVEKSFSLVADEKIAKQELTKIQSQLDGLKEKRQEELLDNYVGSMVFGKYIIFSDNDIIYVLPDEDK